MKQVYDLGELVEHHNFSSLNTNFQLETRPSSTLVFRNSAAGLSSNAQVAWLQHGLVNRNALWLGKPHSDCLPVCLWWQSNIQQTQICFRRKVGHGCMRVRAASPGRILAPLVLYLSPWAVGNFISRIYAFCTFCDNTSFLGFDVQNQIFGLALLYSLWEFVVQQGNLCDMKFWGFQWRAALCAEC